MQLGFIVLLTVKHLYNHDELTMMYEHVKRFIYYILPLIICMPISR